ncbi:MAG TPA: aldo/keto reductase [Longimicrobiaceae bacterium]
MPELGELSRIGFGAYRVSVRSPEHRRALRHALDSGCNLVDTSANYTNGESEALIGEVCAEPGRVQPFIITKAGYVQGDNLRVLEELNRRGLACDELVTLDDDHKHSIHPDFLRSQLELSCRRLGVSRIDGFLLHNPEHYFAQEHVPTSTDEYYSRIGRAFEFLEEMVDEGAIRYYGISSNTLPHPPGAPGSTSLARVLAAAESVSSGHHFRLLQFPFNLFESGAARAYDGSGSLLQQARSHGLVTLGNRPLNAEDGSRVLRIAGYERRVAGLDEAADREVFADACERIRRQLRRVGADEEPEDFTVVQFLRDSWMEISAPELVTQIFEDHFYPFLHHLYAGSVPDDDRQAFARLHGYAVRYAERALTREAAALRGAMVERGEIAADDPRPLPVIACERYLRAGIGHVLVGMRRVEYVDELKELF